MKRIIFLLLLSGFSLSSTSQSIEKRIATAFNKFTNDSQLSYASIGFIVLNAENGNEVFAFNKSLALVPASSQKLLTAAAAFELLGESYRYPTKVYYSGTKSGNTLNGNIYIQGSGDPSLASWRYKQQPATAFADSLLFFLKQNGIERINGSIVAINDGWDSQIIPQGWTWDDMGNYYGAGAAALNWNENQYDLYLNPGKEKAKVKMIKTEPYLHDVELESELVAGPEGSGDRSIIYLAPYSQKGWIKGTVPAGSRFKISGSVSMPVYNAVKQVEDFLRKQNIYIREQAQILDSFPKQLTAMFSYQSPALSEQVYWFLNKSVNLYGEAFIKTFALEKNGFAETAAGVDILKQFWQSKGIPKNALKLSDGSGLSPQNRLPVSALTSGLIYARKQTWYPLFLSGFPLLNGIKMKSGTLSGTKSFAGYSKGSDGKEYVFAIIVNGFNGSSGGVTQKMYKVLDELKK